MFTGLIESIGTVKDAIPWPAGLRMRFWTKLARELAKGDSVAVNGVCLTVVSASRTVAAFDVGPETLRVTTLGALKPGAIVNLERPLRAGARIGGHFVQGHVDGTGIVEQLRTDGEAYWLTIRYPGTLTPYLVRKGSIAVDGISLTIAGLGEMQFDVQIVPFTFQHTNLQNARAQDPVNLECDILGKYVVRAIELQGDGRKG
jgi:riboflavin synthase